MELGDKLSLATRISIRVVLQRKRAEGFADLILAGVRGHLEVGIVVARGIRFDHGDGVLVVRVAVEWQVDGGDAPELDASAARNKGCAVAWSALSLLQLLSRGSASSDGSRLRAWT